ATYFDPKNGDENWFGGGQVRIHPFHFLAVEGSVDYRRTEINSTKVRTFPVQGSVLLYPFGMKRLSPFILGGAGWYFTNVEGPGDFDKTQHRFGAHAGGGLQLFLTEYVSLDGTYRHIWLEKIESKDASLRDKRFEDNGHMVTFGLNVHF
ncbi:MAG: porin family protein, partial [Nitrospira sp.]|nr:porin family protein [Nitrospira sp.]